MAYRGQDLKGMALSLAQEDRTRRPKRPAGRRGCFANGHPGPPGPKTYKSCFFRIDFFFNDDYVVVGAVLEPRLQPLPGKAGP